MATGRSHRSSQKVAPTRSLESGHKATHRERSHPEERVVVAVALFLALPAFLLISLLIGLDSRGPVFFRQTRVGLHGRTFRIYKFRTMIENAEQCGLGLACSHDDDRITRVGRWLRRTSLDELPQLINVALGDMNLVGPRPTVPSQVQRYSRHQLRRLEVKPGLTGWAQVNGRNALSWEERIELDIWYVDHRSRLRDLGIMLRTPLAMVDKRGIYGVDGVTPDLRERG